MKLSEAIRAGTKQTKILRGRLFKETAGQVYACAIGSACYAVDPARTRELASAGLSLKGPIDLFPELDHWVDFSDPASPTSPPESWRLRSVIVRLNDDILWTRPRIAKLVAEMGY
jgi:hypothetical protein